ncbi:pseudouridine synthase [Chromatiaceae bacterium AAb-1]|nr:pseudouridine synthase [Chromatiaceae bacterium AAb-1]
MSEAFSVVADTAGFVVLAKSAGVSFHSELGPGLVVLAEQALGIKLYPVHRLDKVTSGLIVMAKNSHTAALLSAQFQAHQVEKYYLALSYSTAGKKQGWVKGDMAPARRGAYKLLPSHHNPAVSYFISRGFENKPFRAYLIKPFTGKTHQIRVALKSISAPIAGDSLYQGEAADRVYLHAYALCFTLDDKEHQFCIAPVQGKLFQELAADSNTLLQWQTPWLLNWPDYKKPVSQVVL